MGFDMDMDMDMDDMDMDMDMGMGHQLFKAFEHGRPTEEEMGDHMEDMGMPEECVDACMPDEDCVDCAMMVDWENMEDPCEELDDMDDMMDCYEDMMEDMPCMEECEPTDDCEACIEEEGWDMEALEEEMMGGDDKKEKKGKKGKKGGDDMDMDFDDMDMDMDFDMDMDMDMDDMDMDMDMGMGHQLFKAFEHGRPTEEEMGDHMEDMGMPEEC